MQRHRPRPRRITMGLRVNNNIAALNAYRNLSVTDGQMSKSLERLVLGLPHQPCRRRRGRPRHLRGPALADRRPHRSPSATPRTASRSCRPLKVRSPRRTASCSACVTCRCRPANTGGLNRDAQNNIQSEIGQLKAELDRIAEHHRPSTARSCSTAASASFQVGTDAADTLDVSLGAAMSAGGLGHRHRRQHEREQVKALAETTFRRSRTGVGVDGRHLTPGRRS